MNSVRLFLEKAQESPDKMALWLPSAPAVSFSELLEISEMAQALCRSYGVQKGDTVLLLDNLGPRMYASVIALLAQGSRVVLVEPWMDVARINEVIEFVQPKIFLTNIIGRAWGLRVKSVRQIPHWVSTGDILKTRASHLVVEDVDEDHPGIVTFTSGTTGLPKGVVRNQGYMVHQHRVLSNALGLEEHEGPDLCIFANFALANLASGRGSVIVPPGWSNSHLKQIANLKGNLAPESITCGPAFLLKLMETAPQSLKSIHVGGALTDCWIFEKGFVNWPDAHWTHIYGSSEAEPVAISDAKEAVEYSRDRGLFQTLYLGKPVDEISIKIETDGAWVTGDHVCPLYLNNPEENRLHKKKDEQGRVWHFMGDRVRQDDKGWWYSGRSKQKVEDFDLEQKIYSALKSSKSFLQRDTNGELYLLGEKVRGRGKEINLEPDQIKQIIESKIFRDPRHRARIDRKKTLAKGAKWLVG